MNSSLKSVVNGIQQNCRMASKRRDRRWGEKSQSMIRAFWASSEWNLEFLHIFTAAQVFERGKPDLLVLQSAMQARKRGLFAGEEIRKNARHNEHVRCLGGPQMDVCMEESVCRGVFSGDRGRREWREREEGGWKCNCLIPALMLMRHTCRANGHAAIRIYSQFTANRER